MTEWMIRKEKPGKDDGLSLDDDQSLCVEHQKLLKFYFVLLLLFEVFAKVCRISLCVRLSVSVSVCLSVSQNLQARGHFRTNGSKQQTSNKYWFLRHIHYAGHITAIHSKGLRIAKD